MLPDDVQSTCVLATGLIEGPCDGMSRHSLNVRSMWWMVLQDVSLSGYYTSSTIKTTTPPGQAFIKVCSQPIPIGLPYLT